MIIRLALLTASLLFLFSCKKVEQNSVAEFTCQVNGEIWRGTDPEIDRSQDGLIEFTAEDLTYRFLIHLNDNGEAVYSLTAPSNITTVINLAGAGFEEYSTHSSGGENSGILNISAIQTNAAPQSMSGTFSFTAHQLTGENLIVTEGVFNNVPFTK